MLQPHICLPRALYSQRHRCAWSHESNEGTSRLWGQYSPYFPVPSELDPAIPPDCAVTFVQVLSRHGARDPTTYKTELYNATITELQRTVTSYPDGYEFIRDFEYTLGADQLTQFGIHQLREQGRAVAERYPGLAGKEGPFIRASGQQRVIDSAVHWAKGFSEVEAAPSGLEDTIVIVPEGEGTNNTLDHGLCTAFEDSSGDEARDAWSDIFTAPIIARLNANLPGANFTRETVIHLMDLCPFVTVADPTGKPSQFCDLFTLDEWRSYDYYQSLGKFYSYGAGHPLGPTQGVGFVNELIARMTGTPVRDETSTNRTMDRTPETFPMDRKLYADFSHDNTMVSIFAALGLYNVTEGLPRGERVEPGEAGGFSASWTVPFAGRMFVEVMRCGGKEMVRVVVNGRVVEIGGCKGDAMGRCELGEFIKGLEFARGGGRWEECFS